jgi:hypothetical protein
MKIRKLDIIVYPAFIITIIEAVITGFKDGFTAGFN